MDGRGKMNKEQEGEIEGQRCIAVVPAPKIAERLLSLRVFRIDSWAKGLLTRLERSRYLLRPSESEVASGLGSGLRELRREGGRWVFAVPCSSVT